MQLVNPYEEAVIFGKAYPVAWPAPSSTRIRALLPTGAHVGHANALHIAHGKGRHGGPATRLERYSKGWAEAGDAWRGLSGGQKALVGGQAALSAGTAAAFPFGVSQGNKGGKRGDAKWSDPGSVARRAIQPGYNIGATIGNHKRRSMLRSAGGASSVDKAFSTPAGNLTRAIVNRGGVSAERMAPPKQAQRATDAMDAVRRKNGKIPTGPSHGRRL